MNFITSMILFIEFIVIALVIFYILCLGYFLIFGHKEETNRFISKSK